MPEKDDATHGPDPTAYLKAAMLSEQVASESYNKGEIESAMAAATIGMLQVSLARAFAPDDEEEDVPEGQQACPICQGTGSADGKKACPVCGGSGAIVGRAGD